MTKMTKAQLVDENIRLRAQLDVLERQLAGTQELHQLTKEALRAEANVSRETSAKVPHATYYDYVRACKAVARERGQRVASYKSREVWEARVAAYRAGLQ